MKKDDYICKQRSLWRAVLNIESEGIFLLSIGKSTGQNWKGSVAILPYSDKRSNWQITQIWQSDVFRLDLAYSTSIPSLKQKHSSCWKIFKSRYNDTALMSMYKTDTFC